MRRSLSGVLAVVASITAPSLAFGDLLFDGPEFQINTYTNSNQLGPTAHSVARSADGSFVVVWTSNGQDGSARSVHGQRFDSAGAPAGTEFQVNSYTTSDQYLPAVAAAAAGSFVVVWEGSHDGSSRSIHGQRFDSAGAPAGTEFQVNSYTTGEQQLPAVSAAANGSFVVVWDNNNSQDGSSRSIHGQRFDSAGAPAGTEFQVNSYTTADQLVPAVSAAADGSFVVMWQSSQDGSSRSVQGQRFDSAGTPAGTEFQVNSYTTSYQYRAAVSALADGSFVVVWGSTGGQDGSGLSVHGQRFDSTGAPAGTEFQVNSYTTSDQERPAVSAAADGSFVVVWDSFLGQDGSSRSVHGQRFDSAGTPAGTEFQVNSYTTSSQRYSSIAADAAGDFVVVWTSESQDGSGYGMFGQLLCKDANSNPLCDSQETTSCGSAPASGCLGGAKASFQIKDAGGAKNQIKWKLQKGDAFDQLALGDPVTTRVYSLCIYDETAGAPALVASLRIDPNASWEDKAPKGFGYKDKTGAEDGVTKASLKTGTPTKSSVSVSAKGLNIPMPMPFDAFYFFNMDTKVTVQLVNDETSTCWTSEFTVAKTNAVDRFKASAP